MTQTPIGLAWRNGFVRCCSDCFNKPYLIERMKASVNNVVPVIVVDIVTKKAKCYMINDAMTDFIEEPRSPLCRSIEGITNYMINKKNIQKSQLTVDEKVVSCNINELKHYRKATLVKGLQNKFNEHLGKANIPESGSINDR